MLSSDDLYGGFAQNLLLIAEDAEFHDFYAMSDKVVETILMHALVSNVLLYRY